MSPQFGDRLDIHVRGLFNDFLKQHRLGMDLNNAVCELRNQICRVIKNLPAEASISRKLGAPIDSVSLIAFSRCSSCPPFEVVAPPVPFDFKEAQALHTLLPRIQEFREKFKILQQELRPLCKTVSSQLEFRPAYDVERLVYRAFFGEIENRPYQHGDWSTVAASVVTQGVIRNRNVPCDVCGENRRVDRCHIIPNHLGGSNQDKNILNLCPTHHALFDSHMLSEEEWARIDWKRKCEVSQQWAQQVMLTGHKDFWNQTIPTRQLTTLEFLDHREFTEDLAKQILRALEASGGLQAKKLYDQFDDNIRLFIKVVVMAMIKTGMVIKREEKSKILLVLAKPLPEAQELIRGLGSNGTENRVKHYSSFLGSRRGRNSPRVTASGTAKEYRPSMLMWSWTRGESRPASSSRTRNPPWRS